MTWVKVCDRLADHRKWVALELRGDTDAMALWLVALVRSSGLAGMVPERRIGGLLGIGHQREALAAGALVACGLWDRVPGGYQIHDWADYQPSDEQLARATAKASARVARHRSKKASGAGNGACNGVTNGVSNAVKNGPPSRPVTNKDSDSDADARDPLAIRPPYRDRGLLPGGREREPEQPGVPCPPELRLQLARSLRNRVDPFRPANPRDRGDES